MIQKLCSLDIYDDTLGLCALVIFISPKLVSVNSVSYHWKAVICSIPKVQNTQTLHRFLSPLYIWCTVRIMHIIGFHWCKIFKNQLGGPFIISQAARWSIQCTEDHWRGRFNWCTEVTHIYCISMSHFSHNVGSTPSHPQICFLCLFILPGRMTSCSLYLLLPRVFWPSSYITWSLASLMSYGSLHTLQFSFW